MLGHLYYYGIGVEQNYVEATKQWRRAGKQGHAAAMCYLGKCYAQTRDNKKGVVPNRDKAIRLWEASADQGNVKAQYLLDKSEESIGDDTDKSEESIGDDMDKSEVESLFKKWLIYNINQRKNMKMEIPKKKI